MRSSRIFRIRTLKREILTTIFSFDGSNNMRTSHNRKNVISLHPFHINITLIYNPSHKST